MHVQPGPVTSACARRPDGSVLIHLEHTTGSTEVRVDADWVKAFIAQLQEVTGGIVVPQPTIPG